MSEEKRALLIQVFVIFKIYSVLSGGLPTQNIQ